MDDSLAFSCPTKLNDSGSLGSLWIVSDNLDLDPHIVLPEPSDPHARPDRLVIRHVLLEVADHGSQGFIVDGDMIGVDAEDLRPPFASSVLQISLHVRKSQIYLGVDLQFEYFRLRVPAT